MYNVNRESTAWLYATMLPGDVVITHHLPSWQCVDRKYLGDPRNAFYVTNLPALIAAARPAVWIHGRAHTHFDKLLGDTRIVRNPFGYLDLGEQSGYKKDMFIDL